MHTLRGVSSQITYPQRPFDDGVYRPPGTPGWGMTLDEDYIAFARRQ